MEQTEKQFDVLKAKFSPVLRFIDSQEGIALQNLQIQDEKLLIRAAVSSEELRDRLMAEISRVDPSMNEVMPDIRVENVENVPNTGQTNVQPGLEFSRP